MFTYYKRNEKIVSQSPVEIELSENNQRINARNSSQNNSQPPMDPPSYESAIEDNPGLLSRGLPTAPPTYDESISVLQRQPLTRIECPAEV